QPTISDANLILGRLNPAKLKSVEGGVGLKDVQAVFAERLGRPLGLDAHQAADAVIRLANIRMAGAIRMVSVSLGQDPRDFALFAFGGAGPLHATALARELGIPRVLVPARPGITNALGCLVADIRHDFVTTLNRPLDALDMDELAAVFARQTAEGEALIGRETVEIRETRRIHSVDMQFIGQTHLIRVPLDGTEIGRDALRARFEAVYFRRFRVELAEIRAAVVNINTSVIGARAAIDLSTLIAPEDRRATLAEAETVRRPVWFDGWHDTPVYWRDHLPAGFTLTGPAIVEQMDTTVVIGPGEVARGDGEGNILIDVGGAA
ncbi:MAG: hydantoinase/oxoprolinase family protein, partial [Paracoccaceae bacterium]